ncbi:MAG: hypothetical protein JWQ06_1847 [Mucilaginibacter sp.]|nr:hypothetical protein [Mucilaginibacter sp.]
MKTTINNLICLLLFISLSLGATAQSIPDTTRIAIGIDAGLPAGNISSRYILSLGASVRLDFPISKRSYITGSVGYNNFFLANGATTTQQAILNVPMHSLQTVPLKLGYKYFLIKQFYVQGEAGETLLLNKAAQYATKDYAFTYSPQVGMLFKLKKPHNYIDAGLRYEGVSSFYNDKDKYSFWAIHISYAFNL